VPQGYIAVNKVESGLASDMVRTEEARVLFEGPHDLERWDVRARHGAMDIENWKFEGSAAKKGGEEPAEIPPIAEQLAILSIRRGNRVFPMHKALAFEPGDLAAVAIHTEEREAAHELMRARSFVLVPAEPDGDR
ncbi:MAG TPA: hypothetical protein VIY27_03900, partial [Myxococcota bacterium]